MKTINVGDDTKEEFNKDKLKYSSNKDRLLTDEEFTRILLDAFRKRGSELKVKKKWTQYS